MRAFTTAFWKEWTTAIRERRELLSAFAYALAGPLMIAVLIVNSANEARHTGPDTWALCDGAAAPAGLSAWLETQNFTRDDDAKICLIVPDGYEAALAAGNPVHLAIEANLNADERSARRLKSAIESYARAVADDRLLARGVAPIATHPLSVELRNISAISVAAERLVGALVLFLICAPFFISQSTAIDTTAGERERRGLEPLLTQPVPRTALVLSKFAISFVIGIVGTALTVILALIVIGHTPIAELGVRIALDTRTALICAAMLIPLTAAVAALQVAIGLWSRTFKEGQTYALLFAFAPIALGFGALFGGGGAIQPWPVMFEIAALKAPLLGAPWPDLTAWVVSAAISLGIAALALAASVWRLHDERLLAET